MCCKNECLKVCPRRVLQGHNSNICLVSPPLPPALPSSLHSHDCPGEAEITGALWFNAYLSAQIFTPKDPQIMSAQSAARSVMVSLGGFFAGIFFPPNEAPGVHQSPPAPKLFLSQGFFFSRQSSSRKTAKTRTKSLFYLMDSILNKQPVKETGSSLEGWSLCW